MKKFIPLAAVILVIIAAMLLLTSCSGTGKTPALFHDELPVKEPVADVHLRMTAGTERNVIYSPPKTQAGYRYGPAIIYYADGSCDAWFSCMGSQGEWDWISYRHSDDGVTFGDEKVVLTPNPDSMDFFSCCDPGVVYFGGYYYLGYTSTTYDGGVNNNVFVARSRYPDGPFEKWNGEGWGGDPKPIIYYNEDETKYGAGEPSFVVLEDKLYIYYTWCCHHNNYLGVAVADTSENWPLSIKDYGPQLTKDGSDSYDVFYLEDNNKFYGFAATERFSESSGIRVIESMDGIHFEAVDYVKQGFYQFLHNDGIAKRPDGHSQLKDRHFIGYAFSDGASGNWGKWPTCFQEITFELYSGEIEDLENVGQGDYFSDYYPESGEERRPIAISAANRVYNCMEHYTGEVVSVIWFDQYLGVHSIEDIKNVRFYGYDSSIVGFDDGVMNIKGKVGSTFVYIKYKGIVNFFKVVVYPTGSVMPGDVRKEISSFTPVQDKFVIDIKADHTCQIRGYVEFNDHTWAEAFNDGIMLDKNKYPVTFEVEDPSVCRVSYKGIISPLSVGKTNVLVTIQGKISFTVSVEIVDD